MPINLALLVVGISDLLTTLFWLHTGHAIEFNPIMAAVLRAGVPVFVMVKLLTLAAYVVVMEWYRRNRSASFARGVGSLTVTAYLAIYAVSFCCINRDILLG